MKVHIYLTFPFSKLVYFSKNRLLNSGHTQFIWAFSFTDFANTVSNPLPHREKDYKQCLGNSWLFHSQTCRYYFKPGEIDKSFKDCKSAPWMGAYWQKTINSLFPSYVFALWLARSFCLSSFSPRKIFHVYFSVQPFMFYISKY